MEIKGSWKIFFWFLVLYFEFSIQLDTTPDRDLYDYSRKRSPSSKSIWFPFGFYPSNWHNFSGYRREGMLPKCLFCRVPFPWVKFVWGKGTQGPVDRPSLVPYSECSEDLLCQIFSAALYCPQTKTSFLCWISCSFCISVLAFLLFTSPFIS